MKRTIFLFLLGLLLSTQPRLSAQTFVLDGINYKVLPGSDSGLEVAVIAIPEFPYYGDIEIPETVSYDGDSYTVAYIYTEAFYNCVCLTSIKLPRTVDTIGDRAFYGCCNLKSIDLPAGLIDLRAYAFAQCDKLQRVVIPDATVVIKSHCFSNCTSITSITIGKGVEDIYDYAFSGCVNLSSVKIPGNVKRLRDNAFCDCKKLTNVTIADKDNTKHSIYAFAKTPYYEANDNRSSAARNDPRFKVKKTVTY